MSDIRDWVRENNLEQYADVFEANDIDLDTLPELDDHDHERIGLSLGNRRRLMRAIATRDTEVAPISSRGEAVDKSSSASPPANGGASAAR